VKRGLISLCLAFKKVGAATTRDECVKSSQDVYRRLLKLSSRVGILSFDVLKLLSLEDDGLENDAKTDTLKRVFRPDKSDELPLLAFVQSCDAVYKRLRFFRASVRNSSVIERVLQDIIDVFFYFALALLVLSMMNFDPWPLLASVSTLLISFSFAFGDSTARIVDVST
jgi:small-conductance mechanosensitive channel